MSPFFFAKYELKTKLKLCWCTVLIEDSISNLFCLFDILAKPELGRF